MNVYQKIIFWLFAALFFFIPLVLWPYTSEVFEFNKMVLTYILTLGIVATWGVNCITERKIIFRRTILDIPLLIFLGSQLVSTILSIDPQTSWLGYYSRFNGGFLSTFSYTLLYWAFVSNLNKDSVLRILNYSVLPGAALVSIYAVLEHFGIDKNLWVQDVQSRVFSTLGQPNWLAAWILSLIPITWVLTISGKPILKSKNFWVYFALSILFFWTLIFTKSRSGFLAFVVTFIIFWGGYFWVQKKEFKKSLSSFGVITASVFLICLISGTQFTPSLYGLINKAPTMANKPTGPALETGGTESGAIRKIVWRGALDIWAHYPVFGTGVETFAYSYYLYRPKEHNLVSEWDFIYNKAHNEFLNIAANSGTVGIVSYLVLIGFCFYYLLKWAQKPEDGFLNLAFLSGYASLLITNFFGFSVVPTQLMLFILPAFGFLVFSESKIQNPKKQELSSMQKLGVFSVLTVALYLLTLISRYWYADTLFALGKNHNSVGSYLKASEYLNQALKLIPNQPLFHGELATSYVNLALSASQQKNSQNTASFIDQALSETNKATTASPANLNLKRTQFGIFIVLSGIDPKYLLNAREVLIEAIKKAPTDAKLHYNLGLTYARTQETDMAISTLKETIELKENYEEARLAYAYLLIDGGDYEEAKTQLNYILTRIDPNDALAKQALTEIE